MFLKIFLCSFDKRDEEGKTKTKELNTGEKDDVGTREVSNHDARITLYLGYFYFKQCSSFSVLRVQHVVVEPNS